MTKQDTARVISSQSLPKPMIESIWSRLQNAAGTVWAGPVAIGWAFLAREGAFESGRLWSRAGPRTPTI